MQNSWRRWVAVGLASVAGLGSVACEPVDPPPAFVVTSTADLRDAAPGDGVCEATAGAGDCTLAAAIDEGNALGAAAVTVSPGRYDGGRLEVTGRITLHGDVRTVQLGNRTVRIAPGGHLEVDGIYGNDIPGGGFVVEGTLHLRRASIVVIESVAPGIDVLAGGTAVVSDSVLAQAFMPGRPAVRNAGTLVLVRSAVDSFDYSPATGPALVNTGVVYSRASAVTRCSGTAPVSLGANASTNGSCGWTGSDDIVSASLGYDLVLTVPLRYTLRAESILVDAVPLGSPACTGGAAETDLLGTQRGVDGNGDGVPGCDIGAVERPAPPA